MTAASDRILLRWLPLALVLLVAATAVLMTTARPFASQDWPRPTRSHAIERVIDVPGPAPRD